MSDVLNEKVALVSLSIATFAGYRRATREQIEELGGSLPASAAVTEGSIKVFPSEGVTDLTTIRRKAFREIGAKSIKAMGSRTVFAVPRTILDDIEGDLGVWEKEFAAAKVDLDANYDALFEDHVKKNPEAEAIIRARMVPRTEAIARCRFGFHLFSINPIVKEGEDAEKGVEGILQGLGRQLFEEVASEMESLLKNKCFAEQKVGQKSLRPISAQLSKMAGFTFLDESVEGAIKFIQDILASLPKAGYITGQAFIALQRLVDMSSDPDELFDAACRVKNGVPACDVIFPPQPVAEVVEAAPAAEAVAVPPAEAEPVAAPAPAGEAPKTTEAKAPAVPVAPRPRAGVVPLRPPVPPRKPALPMPPRGGAELRKLSGTRPSLLF
jgi:hypothetical protein